MMEPKIAYGIRAACRAFDPPIGERKLRAFIKAGRLKTHAVGSRNYILKSDIEALVKKLPGAVWKGTKP
jgi:hypothetical protein